MTITVTNVHNLYMRRSVSSNKNRRQSWRQAVIIGTGVVLLLCLLYAAFFAQGDND
jgi:hypothetical protein